MDAVQRPANTVKNNTLTTLDVMYLNLIVTRLLRQQGIAGLLAEGLEIPTRMRVGGQHGQHLPAFQLSQRFLGAQDRQGAIQPPGVDFLIRV